LRGLANAVLCTRCGLRHAALTPSGQGTWAREASLCEGISNPFQASASPAAKERAEEPGAAQIDAPPPSPPLVDSAEVERELLVEELRTLGTLAEEDWTHEEASAHLTALPDLGLDCELELEQPTEPPRRVLLHVDGLVVLETPHQQMSPNDESSTPAFSSGAPADVSSGDLQGDDAEGGWVTRSLHFEESVGVVQTEVRYHPGRGIFDRVSLSFAIHGAFRALLLSMVPHIDLARGVAVLGGGGGALPMALASAAGEGALSDLGPVAVVERDRRVAEAAASWFGFREGFGNRGNSRVELFMVDARKFFDHGREFAAVFVDIAGEAGISARGADPLAPPPQLLAETFVRDAAAAVSAARGFVAWNVLACVADEAVALRNCMGAVAAALPTHMHVSVLGPMRHHDGNVQWLLVASTTPVNAGSQAIEAEKLRCLSAADLEISDSSATVSATAG